MTKILAIDPGPTQSAFVIFNGKEILEKGIFTNHRLMHYLDFNCLDHNFDTPDITYEVIEQVHGMGMAVGADVFETVYWSGIFACTIGLKFISRIPRHKVKMHLCGSMRAGDTNILTALVDRFDPLREYGKYGKGTKKRPGPFFGMKSHLYSALALAVTFWDQRIVERKGE